MSSEIAERIAAFPALMNEAEKELVALPQVHADIIHTFAPGIYMRHAVMPAQSLMMGHSHKTDHLNLLLRGTLTMFNADGSRSTLSAPWLSIGQPGRKMAYTHDECVWVNVHSTDCRDVEQLDEMFLDMTDHWKAIKAQPVAPRLEDIEDFERVLGEIGLTAEEVQHFSQTDDVIPFPYGSYKCKVANSAIAGRGLFATARIAEGEMICLGRIGQNRTPAGRYINHGKHPNAKMALMPNNDIGVFAIKDITGSCGGHDGEEITVDYIQGLKVNLESMQ